jgi:N-acetyl-gamma-glutamylphosphate reductase
MVAVFIVAILTVAVFNVATFINDVLIVPTLAKTVFIVAILIDAVFNVATFWNETFIDVMPFGSQPDTRSVRASNTLRIALQRPGNGDRLIILVVQDNLVKGASGQAIQNMNLMFGLPESAGLNQVAILP